MYLNYKLIWFITISIREKFYMYEGKKVYGSYTRKDGRQIVILKTPGNTNDHRTVSYPKYLVECFIGRYLECDETIDHIDGNFSNNELSNLRIVNRSEHCRSHTKIKQLVIKQCCVCGGTFTTNDNNRVTCGSKSCRGRCAHINGYNKGNSFRYNNENIYLDMRDSIEHIKPLTS